MKLAWRSIKLKDKWMKWNVLGDNICLILKFW
jgi:hypothetical protein